MNQKMQLPTLLVACAVVLLIGSSVAAEENDLLRSRTESVLKQPPLRLPVPDASMTEEQRQRTSRALHQSPIKGMPDVKVARPQGVDINEIIRSSAPELQTTSKDSLGPMIFVSLSMPVASLKKLAMDAQKVGGVLLLRGTINRSLKETVAAIKPLADQGVEVNIDPTSFERYGIKVVPTFVVDLSGAQGCDGGTACAQRSALIEGDVTLGHALEHIARTTIKDGSLHKQVAVWQSELEGRR
jgi:conjugal transfer pilus assembly protein TrbC